MRFIDRLIILIFSVLLIVLAVAGTIFCFMPDVMQTNLVNVIDILVAYRWFVLLGAAALLIIGLLVMFGSAFHRKHQSKSTTVNASGEGDIIQISVGAIDCIVGQVVKGYSQVKSVNTEVSQTPDGIKIKAKTVVNGDINIPELAKQLQTDIKIQLEQMVGLKVKDVKIVVTDVVAKPITVNKEADNSWDDVEAEAVAAEVVDENK